MQSSVGDITLDNWQQKANARIASDSVTYGRDLTGNEKGSILSAFRQAAGLSNGYYTVGADGAATADTRAADAVLDMPLVRIADRASGNAVDDSTSLWQDISNGAMELAGNFKAKFLAADGSVPTPPGGWVLWIAAGGGLAALFLIWRIKR